ncbi:MAG: alpha-amylase family glycosyl hydrolase, partial [Burkholderiaceae bacterium]
MHLPAATAVSLLVPGSAEPAPTFVPGPAPGTFTLDTELPLEPLECRLLVKWPQLEVQTADPYTFGLLLADDDLWLFGEGRHSHLWKVLGAHRLSLHGIAGTRFAVWAPNASSVAVVGDFNVWDPIAHPMRARVNSGVWELFVPLAAPGDAYKFAIRDAHGQMLDWRADPFARRAEHPPRTGSVIVAEPDAPVALRPLAGPANRRDQPISIYEVHPGSWRRMAAPGRPEGRMPTWDELAATLVPYVRDLGFTHLELMPQAEYPFDGSWGYQPVSLYAPTARHGDAQGLRRFINACHEAGLAVILDWVSGHFPTDAHGLGRFDGSPLYEYADPREGFHQDWNTLIYNYRRPEVRNFLLANARYWVEEFGIDGLRVDAVSSMLF